MAKKHDTEEKPEVVEKPEAPEGMAELTLGKAYIHFGTVYGPGTVYVPEYAVDDLTAAVKRNENPAV